MKVTERARSSLPMNTIRLGRFAPRTGAEQDDPQGVLVLQVEKEYHPQGAQRHQDVLAEEAWRRKSQGVFLTRPKSFFSRERPAPNMMTARKIGSRIYNRLPMCTSGPMSVPLCSVEPILFRSV